MISRINNNTYNNKLGEDTFLSKVQKINKTLERQDTLINNDEELNIHESEMHEKAKEMEIAKKISKGAPVSVKDLKYIKKHNPELLQKAKKVKMSKKNTEMKIKSAKSEKEVDNIMNQESIKALTSIASNDKSGEINIEGQLAKEAVEKIKNETVYRRIDKLV